METHIVPVVNELKELGYSPFVRNTVEGETVFIRYTIPIGKYSGETVILGVSFDGPGYPECPPHWIHISPPYDDGREGGIHNYSCEDENGETHEFRALSRLPNNIWDKLPTKNMKNYLSQHINRFCKNLK